MTQKMENTDKTNSKNFMFKTKSRSTYRIGLEGQSDRRRLDSFENEEKLNSISMEDRRQNRLQEEAGSLKFKT